MPKTDPRLEGLAQGGQGTATAAEMAKRFPEMFDGLNPEEVRPDTATPPAGGISRVAGPPGGPPGGRPPAGFQGINYSDRGGFEEAVFNNIGGSPFDIDPYEFVEQSNAQLPEIFNQVFRGKIIWSDRGKMDKNQAKFWNAVVAKFHAHVFDRATQAKKMMTEKYNFMMNRFDNDKKGKDAALKRIQQSGKAPETRDLVNKEGKLTLHQWDAKAGNAGEWVDTGKGKKVEPEGGKVPPVVTKALGLVERAAKNMAPEVANMLDNNPDVAKIPWFQAMMNQEASPEMKALLKRQWEIINSFYGLGSGGSATMGSAGLAEETARGGEIKFPGPELSPSHERSPGSMPAPKAKPGTAGKAKRVKMDREGNLL